MLPPKRQLTLRRRRWTHRGSRIADRLIALAAELRPSSPSRRSQAGTTDRRTTTKAAITSSKVLRDARTSKSPKTAAARALSERTKKKTG